MEDELDTEDEQFPESERLQIQRIRELDMEELQIEEVDDDFDDDDDDGDGNGRGPYFRGQGDSWDAPHDSFTYDTRLASQHSYLGDIDATHVRFTFLDGGVVLNLPILCVQGVVLFPEANLPLRVFDPQDEAIVERAMNRLGATHAIGVVRIFQSANDGRFLTATTGTTAEIRRFGRMDDGSISLLLRGQQRFRWLRRWIDTDGTRYAEVQIVQEDTPLRIPKATSAQLASVASLQTRVHSNATHSGDSTSEECESSSFTSISSDFSVADMIRRATDSPDGSDEYEVSSSDVEYMKGQGRRSQRYHSDRYGRSGQSSRHEGSLLCKKQGECEKDIGKPYVKRLVHKASLAFWPQWVYEMYDSYSLAQKAADLWKQIMKTPSMNDIIRKPDILSYHIGSHLPVSESTRQELLDIDGISYRLQREIQILESVDLIRCKNCKTVIAKRSDVLVMSCEGPLNAYVNPHGYVHEVITVHNASGLALLGSPVREHSWFPGYAWTITNCTNCEAHMGWLFTATKKKLLPRSFWGIRGCQVAEIEC